MKFKVYPYGSAILNVGFILFGSLTLLFVAGAVFFPYARFEYLIASSLGFLLIALLMTGTRETHSWVWFDQTGIRRKSVFGSSSFIAWEECIDIGIMRSDVGSWGIHHYNYWIYFS